MSDSDAEYRQAVQEVQASLDRAFGVDHLQAVRDDSLMKELRAVGLSEAGATQAARAVQAGDPLDLAVSMASAFHPGGYVDRHLLRAYVAERAAPPPASPVVATNANGFTAVQETRRETAKRRIRAAVARRMPASDQVAEASAEEHMTFYATRWIERGGNIEEFLADVERLADYLESPGSWS